MYSNARSYSHRAYKNNKKNTKVERTLYFGSEFTTQAYDVMQNICVQIWN
jgi:hypothetical protein